MRKLQRSDVEPIGKGYRYAASFFFVCSLIAILGVVVFSSVSEWIEQGFISLWFLFLIVSGTYVSGSLAFTGYAPWYLLSAHKPKMKGTSGVSGDKL